MHTGHQKSMWNQEEIANFYAEFSQNYDQDIENDQSCYPSPFRIGTWAVEWLKNRRIHNHSTLSLNSHQKTREIVNILDLGCGTGQSGVMFVEHGRSDPSFQYTLTGVDTTPEVCLISVLL